MPSLDSAASLGLSGGPQVPASPPGSAHRGMAEASF